jgi:biopolymer transport protein ExbD
MRLRAREEENMRAAILCLGLLTASVAQAGEPPRVTDVFVMSGGDLTINHGPVLSFPKFKKQMEPLLRRPDCEHLRIRAADDVPFGAIGRVVRLLQSSGCAKIGFLTEPANTN